jgi:demethylmenaquinone methyltransferase/2-methoxy-6-polyprenyl-1,4-benzoquinol methylase
MSGTTPPGVAGEQQVSAWVRETFSKVAPRYDFLNHVLSMNVDRYWRWKTVRALREALQRQDAEVMDLCCGTGDLLLALQKASKARIWGSDFCHPMLTAAAKKIAHPRLYEADALMLPLKDRSVDVITIAFGFRNFANYEKGLVELRRVLRPGGTLAILEFSTPPNRMFRALYGFYSRNILSPLGNAISGASDAYSYLPESVCKFPGAVELAEMMRGHGYRDVRFERMTFGIAALHIGHV